MGQRKVLLKRSENIKISSLLIKERITNGNRRLQNSSSLAPARTVERLLAAGHWLSSKEKGEGFIIYYPSLKLETTTRQKGRWEGYSWTRGYTKREERRSRWTVDTKMQQH